MSKDRWRNWGLFILVTLSMVQGISLTGSADFNDLTDVSNSRPVTDLEELYLTEAQNQPEIIPERIFQNLRTEIL